MSRVLLDTSAYSAFKRGNPGVIEAVRRSEELALTPVVLGELLAGFRRGSREARNCAELEEFLASPRVRTLPIDRETSERYAVILAYLRERGTPLPANDIWIAASAMQFGLPLLTGDRHFERIPQILVRWIVG